jgi:hypothetical protein
MEKMGTVQNVKVPELTGKKEIIWKTKLISLKQIVGSKVSRIIDPIWWFQGWLYMQNIVKGTILTIFWTDEKIKFVSY